MSVVSPDAPIAEALGLIAQHGYSQLPVYDEGAFVQLLTTNIITRWVAEDLADTGAVSSATVRDVLDHGEPADRAVFLPRTASAQESIDALTDPAKDGTHAFAAIITEQGKPNEKPIRIISPADLSLSSSMQSNGTNAREYPSTKLLLRHIE